MGEGPNFFSLFSRVSCVQLRGASSPFFLPVLFVFSARRRHSEASNPHTCTFLHTTARECTHTSLGRTHFSLEVRKNVGDGDERTRHIRRKKDGKNERNALFCVSKEIIVSKTKKQHEYERSQPIRTRPTYTYVRKGTHTKNFLSRPPVPIKRLGGNLSLGVIRELVRWPRGGRRRPSTCQKSYSLP